MGIGDIFKGGLTGFVSSGGSPWGAAAGALTGLLGGGGGGGSSASALSSAAPTQTPDQAEMSALAKPYLQGWLTSPPKISGRPIRQTGITVGDKFSYRPSSVTGTFGSGAGTPKDAAGNRIPTNIRAVPAQAATPARPSNLSPAVQGAVNQGWVMAQPPTLDTSGMYYARWHDPNDPSKFGLIPMNANDVRNYNYFTQDPQSGLINTNGGSLRQPQGTESATPGATQTDFGFPNPGRQFDVQPGQLTIAAPPTSETTYGREGGFQTGPDRFGGLQVGFGDDYLRDLAARGVDPLREAYGYALDKADADANRMNLVGSGFQQADKFGNQPGSITRTFLDRASDVARDVTLRGAEAAREDQFRKQGLLSGQDQTSEANRQWWAQTLTAQREYDNAIRAGDWERANSLYQFLASRDDQNMRENQLLDMQLQEKNIGLQQGGLENVLQYIYGQAPQASAANRNYWAGIDEANRAETADNAALAQLATLGGTLFGGRKAAQPVVQPTPVSTYLNPGTWNSALNTGLGYFNSVFGGQS